MSGTSEHVPVLYEEVLTGLQIKPGGLYVDATIGAGGHATGILEQSAPDGKLVGLDADPEAISYAREVLERFGDRAVLRVSNFRSLAAVAHSLGIEQVDGVLLDLGLSSRQLARSERGFSFLRDGPLDMRMDPSGGQCAADLINELPEAELANLIWRYGEERRSRSIARAIVAARPVTTTRQLADLVLAVMGHRERIHPATRTFQALRIAVNDELAALTETLPQARDLLAPGGRLVVISFHSLEDRLAKNFLKQEARDCICPPEILECRCNHRATLKIVTRKAVRPGTAELARNARSRSAKLRIGERLHAGQATWPSLDAGK